MSQLHSSATIKVMLTFLIVLLGSPALAQSAIESPRIIQVVLDNAYAPYSFLSSDGKLQGILIDQWQAWERKTGIKANLHALDWGEAVARMRSGEFDVIDSIVETPERRGYFDFTPGYAMTEASIFFRKDISGITDLGSLKGVPVGVKQGDQHIEILKDNGVTTVISFRNNDEIIEAAKRHKINVFVVDAPSAVYLLNKAGIEAEFRQSAPVFRDDLRRAVRKGDTKLLHTVADGFANIDPRELQQINEKWFGRPINGYARYLTFAGYATAVAMLLIAGLAAWNRSLRSGVLQRTAQLGESELRFRQIAENIQGIFWMSTPAMDELLYVSPAYEEVWGRSLESVRREPRSFFDAIHEDDRADAMRIMKTNRTTGFDIEYRVRRPDGTQRWVRDRGFPVKDASGKVYRIAGICEDITDRRRMDEALRQSEFELAEAQRVAGIGNWTFDVATKAVRWSKEIYRIFDVDDVAFANTYETFLSRVHPDDRARVLAANAEARTSGNPFELEYRVKTRRGELKNIREVGYARRDSADRVIGLFGTAQDITERTRSETALRESGVQLQALSHRLVELQESERKALARELHDRVGQSLSAININLAVLRGATAQHGAEIRARLDDSAALLQSTAQAIESVLSDLRPPMLDDYGLLAALEWYADQFSARTRIAVSVRGTGSVRRIAPDLEIVLFRIAQEALNNVAKHARARTVIIALQRRRTEYLMSVEDDGVGLRAIEEVMERSRPGLGIVTMRERAQAIGGQFQIESMPEGGTRLTVRIPQ